MQTDNQRSDKSRCPRASLRESAPASPPRIRLVVADANAIDREGLVLLLRTQPDFHVAAEAETATLARDRCRELSPGVLILDTVLLDSGGADNLAVVREISTRTRILALAGRSAEHCIVLSPPRPDCLQVAVHNNVSDPGLDCLQLAASIGARGAIRRNTTPAVLFAAIRAVESGALWYESRVAQWVLDRETGTHRDAAHALTERDVEVAALVGAGCSNKEIAKKLDVCEAIAKRHVGHILEKLGLQDRLQLGLYVARNPLVLTKRASGAGAAATGRPHRLPL